MLRIKGFTWLKISSFGFCLLQLHGIKPQPSKHELCFSLCEAKTLETFDYPKLPYMDVNLSFLKVLRTICCIISARCGRAHVQGAIGYEAKLTRQKNTYSLLNKHGDLSFFPNNFDLPFNLFLFRSS